MYYVPLREPLFIMPRGESLFLRSTRRTLICYALRQMIISYDPLGGCLLLMLLEEDLRLFCKLFIYNAYWADVYFL